MEKEKFTLRVEKDLLKEMKIVAIHKEMPLNELLILAYQLYFEKECEKETLFEKK